MKKFSHLVNVPETSTISTGSADYQPDYFNKHGDLVYAHMIHAKEINQKKHLVQFPISVNLKKDRNSVEASRTQCPTVLLKTDTGADVNLMNLTTFNSIIGDRSILQPSTLKMKAYGNSAVKVLGKFHVFLRGKGRIYRQLFFITTANASPNLLSRDGCYTLGVLEALLLCGKFQQIPRETPSDFHTAYNWPGQAPRCMIFHHIIFKWRKLWGEAALFHSVVFLQWATSRHAIEETGHP